MLALSFCRWMGCALGFAAALTCEAQADQMRISNLSTLTMPMWIIGDPDVVLDELVCIYRENTSGTDRSYAITAIGDGPGFALTNPPYSLIYNVTWNDGGAGNPTGGSTSTLVNNIALSGLTNARIKEDVPTNSDDCNGGASPTAQLRITVTNAHLQAAPAGTYSGTLTLVLAPN